MNKKKEFWKMNVNELQQTLQQLETEKMRAEMQSRRFLGDLTIPMTNKRQAKTKGDTFNFKEIRKNIARIKTILHIKLKANETQN